ncbi:MAG: TonB-dependent receptor [Gammaproteobacteria bacterium]|nr:TonB-dependent receptor [Gammaproteobacteria bacterium]MDH5628884.1 TonB-dependent receptor [Gammaproteobacteria bacterium]
MNKHFYPLLFVFSASLHANEEPQKTVEDDTPVLIVTGSPVLKSMTGDSKDLQSYYAQPITDAGELLNTLPGFSGIRAGGHGVDPVLRGQSQTRLNVIQQGAFLHGAGPNRMDSPGAYTEPFSWDEVQIIKGVESLVYGTGGPVGTINFIRYRPDLDEKSLTGKLMTQLTSDSSKFASDLAVGDSTRYLRVINQYHDQDSYRDGDDLLTRTAFNTVSNTLVAGYNPDTESEVRISAMANRGSDALFAGTMMDGPKTDMDAYQVLYLSGDPDGENYQEVQYYANKAHHIMDNYTLREQTAPMRMLTDSYSETRGAQWLNQLKIDNVIWKTSLDWQQIRRNAMRYMGMTGRPYMPQSTVWPDNQIDIKGAAIEAQFLFSQSHRLISGIRFDHVAASANSDNQLLYTSYYADPKTQQNERNFSGFSRYYFAAGQSVLWLGVSSTTRTADATERYLGLQHANPMMRWIGNPNLNPERHNQVELGYKWGSALHSMEINLYYNSVSDFILRDRAHGQTDILLSDNATIYRNVDVNLYGLEWSSRHQFDSDWLFESQLAWIRGYQQSNHADLYQIPPIEGALSLSNQTDTFSYWINLRFAFEQNHVDDSMMTGSGLDAGNSDSWQALDFKTRYSLNENWQLLAGVNNILDETYAYHVSRANLDPFNPTAERVNEPGRQYWLSLTKTF